nr:hypothetical protein [Tanacetum cinerariifolium]
MKSSDWTEINAGIQQHLQKAYNTNTAAFKAHHWVIDPTTGTYNVEKIRRTRPENTTARKQSSTTQEYPSLIGTFFVATLLTGNSFGIRTDEGMRRLEATGTYTDDEINRLARGDMSPGNICHCGTYFLTGKYVGPIVSPGIVVGEGIPYECFPATIPRRQVAGETYPP